MLMLLAILNSAAFLYSVVLWSALAWPARRIFLGGVFLALLAALLGSLLLIRPWQLPELLEVVGFFFRGWFIISIASGSLACYLANKEKPS